MTVPTIHTNGTSKRALLDALNTAHEKIGDAYEALRQTAPNGRDYYLQDAHAMTRAVGEHAARQRKLDDVRNELEELIQKIDEQ